MNASEYAKENNMATKEVMAKFGLTHHLQAIPEQPAADKNEDIKQDATEKPSNQIVTNDKSVKEKSDYVTFFWKNNRNFSFSLNGRFVKTEKSTIKLSKKTDADVIAFLRKHAKNEKNGGGEFAEFDEADEKGIATQIDTLIGLDMQTLAAMVGGKVADFRKSRGTLITEILKLA